MIALSRNPLIVALGVAAVFAFAQGAAAQVRIDMPPPPRKPQPAAMPPAAAPTTYAAPGSASPAPASATGGYATASATTVEVGDVALARYARARASTYNTYSDDGSYWRGGVRVYSYPRYIPQFVWGPWYGGMWPGWPFRSCW